MNEIVLVDDHIEVIPESEVEVVNTKIYSDNSPFFHNDDFFEEFERTKEFIRRESELLQQRIYEFDKEFEEVSEYIRKRRKEIMDIINN